MTEYNENEWLQYTAAQLQLQIAPSDLKQRYYPMENLDFPSNLKMLIRTQQHSRVIDVVDMTALEQLHQPGGLDETLKNELDALYKTVQEQKASIITTGDEAKYFPIEFKDQFKHQNALQTHSLIRQVDVLLLDQFRKLLSDTPEDNIDQPEHDGQIVKNKVVKFERSP